jgi:hypothetical protein
LLGIDAAFLLPGGEKDRMRGFGVRVFSHGSEPLTPTLSPPGFYLITLNSAEVIGQLTEFLGRERQARRYLTVRMAISKC